MATIGEYDVHNIVDVGLLIVDVGLVAQLVISIHIHTTPADTVTWLEASKIPKQLWK